MLRTLAALLLFGGAAQAADSAQSRAIGFSPDGAYFAFEQYGVQDGSGFPYSEIFVLDIAKDAWVQGTPVKVLRESEEATIDEARADALRTADPVLKANKVSASYDTLANMPFTEIIADRRKVRFARYYASSGNAADYDAIGSFELSVKDVPVAQNPECPDSDFMTIVGMELILKNVKTGVSKTIAKDATIPKSRFCPSGYDLEAIYAPSGFGLKTDPHVALIGVYSRGFEGSDRRIIAVPFELFE